MTENNSSPDTVRALLVPVATIGMIAFNWLASIGRVNGVTPDAISNKYSTLVTPSGYAFAIWSLIYLGLVVFSVYQALPAKRAKFRGIRSFYILSCALNCGWIYMWHYEQIAVCFAIIVLLSASLFLICAKLVKTESHGEYWFAKAPFGLYFGWITAAALVNLAVLFAYLNVQFTEGMATAVAVILILVAGLLGVVVRIRLNNYLYPLAIAWAVAAIGVKQSGQTLIVVASAISLVAGLIAAMSFVTKLPSSNIGETIQQ